MESRNGGYCPRPMANGLQGDLMIGRRVRLLNSVFLGRARTRLARSHPSNLACLGLALVFR